MNATGCEAVTPEVTAMLEALPLSVAVVRPDGTLCYANAPAQRLAKVLHTDPELGITRLIGGTPAHERDPDCTNTDCEDRLVCADEFGKPLTVVRQWRRCGDTGLLSVTFRPAGNDHHLPGQGTDAATGVASLTGDPCDLLHTDKLATVGQLAAGMAHEINNPVCYVQSNLGTFRDYVNKLFGLLELADQLVHDPRRGAVERGKALDARKQAIDFATIVQDLPALLEESREGVERIRHIVQSLRDFSRADVNDSWQLYDVYRTLDSTLDIVRSVSDNYVQCTTSYEPLPLVECHPTELNQLFTNILINASQAIESNGHITISGRPLGTTHVQIDITDDGCGMDEQVLSHLFEPFFTTKGVGKGTGLGLPISYGIVKKHSGDIVVRSAPGRGTTFQITLPVKQPRPQQPQMEQ
ncbi:MAG TPA: ATP-binding protein [Rhodanobacteraceae bacterium]|jgi:signal transduction histidine kinase|nr:ATP-binding protein [Rhodanobacteraceae bacterium]